MEAKGWRIPPHLFPPDILPGYEGWLDDFFELGTERQSGPIPKGAIDRHVRGWLDDEADIFRHVIRAMDSAFMKSQQPGGDVPQSDNPARDAFRVVMGRPL